ncbi:UpxY family transcription antiterminator [Alistipes sp. ZOR0009]|uniref:UpxY family transcription antiterminator n=1 Tax=Alistipes sp. ZOR0009 TaxID=1339253 RepID=UPI00068D274B|nr:UpxY family transcription antiterminator [Alistipes sp. ZOR0009]
MTPNSDQKDLTKRWLVGYTTPRAEKQVYEKLLKQGYTVFLPLAKASRRWSDRIKIVEIPLFTSYIFVKANSHEIYESLRNTPGLIRYLYIEGKFAEVSDKEIDNIKKFLSKTEGYQFSFEENQTVEIKDGVLKGRRGVVTKLGKDKLQLKIEQFGWVVKAEVFKTQAKVVD